MKAIKLKLNTIELDIKQSAKDKVINRLKITGINPNEKLGQHFLINDSVIDLLSQAVNPKNSVIEIGPGVGQLTDALSQKANRVIAIEIDKRYEPILNSISKEHSNVDILFNNVLSINFKEFFQEIKKINSGRIQIIASLPYHITEPFLHKLINLPLESITLVIGDHLARATQAKDENDPNFGQLTLLTQTFFDIEIIAQINKDKFFPIPRTNSAIIKLTPKKTEEFKTNKRNFLFKRLFTPKKRNPLIKNALKDGLIEFNQETKSLTQNQAREIINLMNIPQETLNKSFQQLNNNELKILSKNLTF